MSSDIEIVFHLGAPHTDNEQLTWSLRQDSELLAENGVLLRRPNQYRALLSDMIAKNSGGQASRDDQEKLLSAIIRKRSVNRLILSNSKFLGVPAWMLNLGELYRNAAQKTSELRGLFSANPCEFFLAIRNPATFIPDVYWTQVAKSYDEFIGDVNLTEIRWSHVIASIRRANPGCPITVWCNEDTPIIWPTVLSEVAGLDHMALFSGELDLLKTIMSREGIDRLTQYLADHPSQDPMERRQIKAAFLEKYFVNDAVENEIDLPGWTEELVEEMTDIYDDDLEEIEQMSGVEFISA